MTAPSASAYVRLMVTRGTKAALHQDPRAARAGPTIVVLPEWEGSGCGGGAGGGGGGAAARTSTASDGGGGGVQGATPTAAAAADSRRSVDFGGNVGGDRGSGDGDGGGDAGDADADGGAGAPPVPVGAGRARGIRLFTTHVRRGAPDAQDPGLNSHSKLNCVVSAIQAAKAGADEALMLSPDGFVATCNSTNFFIVRRGELWAPRGGHMMRGVTRALVMALAEDDGVAVRELDFTLAQAYSADEAFVTGTLAGIVPVREIDGRAIGSGARGPLTARLQALYAALMDAEAAGGRAAALDDGS